MQSVTPTERRGNVLAVVVLGTDAALAGLPATPVQLAHACLRAGYDLAVPASWGDELIAAGCLRELAARGPRPAIMCVCPHVRRELLEVGSDLEPMLVSMVSPPIAIARYFHALYGRERVHLTYVGDCPGAGHEEIDDHRSTGEFLAFLATAGIDISDQPLVFDSIIPPDRRRFYSMAGGLPSAEQLWGAGNARSLVELDGDDYLIDLAQHLLSHECALIDLAPRLGCACSGASTAVPPRSTRAAVAVIEPPRAASAVINVSISVELAAPISVVAPPETGWNAHPGSIDAPAMNQAEAGRLDPSPSNHSQASLATRARALGHRRGSPAIGVRAIQIAVPVARIGGRWLPRAYAGKRRGALPVGEDSRQSPRGRVGVGPVAETGPEENGRARPATRVAASSLRNDTHSVPAVAAAAAGAPGMMGDPPRG